MEQRRLRLGDIVDDYCSRERRVTNHAVVAMVEEDVKQTRCTTCDTEHPYKGGKAPRRRKKDTTGALYKEVLAGLTDGEPQPVLAPMPVPPPAPAVDVPAAIHSPASSTGNGNGSLQPHAHVAAPVDAPEPVVEVDDAPVVEDGPVHRPLIRATLPRLEGHKEERKATDFTIRQPTGRGGQQFQSPRGADQNRGRPRPTQGHGQSQPANRPPGAGARFAGSRPGQQARGASSGRPTGGGFRGGPPQGRSTGNGNANGNGNTAHGGGRKRSR
ncbi:MAG: hypothetical protein ABIX28_02795 [Vicinamibacterales bacterium]